MSVRLTKSRKISVLWQYHTSDLQSGSLSVNFTSWLPQAQERLVILPRSVTALMEPFKSETAAEWYQKACSWCHVTAVCSIKPCRVSVHFLKMSLDQIYSYSASMWCVFIVVPDAKWPFMSAASNDSASLITWLGCSSDLSPCCCSSISCHQSHSQCSLSGHSI